MLRKCIFTLTVLASITIVFTGCSRNGSVKSGESSATGWKIGENGGFDYKGKDYKDQIQGPNLILIHGGTFTKGRVQDDVMKDWNNAPTRMQVRSFYMDETEVTNLMYIEYLDWLKRVFVQEDGTNPIYISALPDTLVWRNQLGYYDDMVNNYLRHPAFRTHPVVGVSWQQANNFAKWRTNRVNELILEEKGWIAKGARTSDAIKGRVNFDTETYLKRPDLVYGENYTADNVRAAENDTEDQTQSFVGRRAQITVRGEGTEEDDVKVTNASVEYGIVLPEYRLPTESEWEYAALGLAGIREYNSYQGKKKYPWSGDTSRVTQSRNAGDQLANFKQGRGDYSGVAGWSNDDAEITADVYQYPPNDFGLYGMAGNVSEWVADVYRPLTNNEVSDMNYFRGNLFQTYITEDGKASVNNDVINYDDNPNGRSVYSQLPGSIQKQNIVPNDFDSEFTNEQLLNTNGLAADNLAYADGDKLYQREKGNPDGEEMYTNAFDETRIAEEKRLTLVSNTTRVIKGASWKDRAYWLDPAQRRYMPEFLAADYIGFRCAMSYLGSTSEDRKPRGIPKN
ncbi:MAG: gliding motility lipoprotein GldJ [Flavobacteriaceae bacterium]|nr:gliding motility lipoprotein GldJ [Flavobacteriaceae bacterium]|tara:strand:- start:2089 stop:3789 length:1701 start_codon:yes stop_codon:yes gene_type:complete